MDSIVILSSKMVCKSLFADPEEAVGKERDGASIGLKKQHDLFPDDLSQLMAQDIHIFEDPALNYLDTIMDLSRLMMRGRTKKRLKMLRRRKSLIWCIIRLVYGMMKFRKIKRMQNPREQQLEKKTVNSNVLFTGVSSRKRNVHSLTSPGKRTVTKPISPTVGRGTNQVERAPPKRLMCISGWMSEWWVGIL
ncbi:uncharacterized protein LOC110226510 [Arabidopsis lyrata subsp. lyrata]|uniref:uncharacterized protein LOC110226510 n=1 Tax=Arabidopsis lyrata subsp. lyrata TaxID=81972 RepID=UPI000A29B81E|nr:uncharacterized protein LOC110226510 [Arabidopsis lyrata subsp. lyrata]|eukprot:XP_020874101.1 uncharacterized protein LOC110226510 [Arabidopsis lyrata subsp. lyrata]